MPEEEKLKPLTEKQKIFCREYIFDWNGSRAARVAGYSEKTAKEIASENLTKPNIKAYIKDIQNNLEEVSGISKLRVLKEYEKLAFSSIAHLHETWIDRKDFEKLTDDQKACISEINTRIVKKNIGSSEIPEIVDVESIQVKLYDKSKALDSIKKMLGHDAVEQIDITSKGEQITGMVVK